MATMVLRRVRGDVLVGSKDVRCSLMLTNNYIIAYSNRLHPYCNTDYPILCIEVSS